MRTLIAAAVCAVPLAVATSVHAQGAKGQSGSGAENASKQSRTTTGSRDNAGNANTSHNSHNATGSNGRADDASNRSHSAPDQESSMSVEPDKPRASRTVEQDMGKNRSSSGDSAGSGEPDKDYQGLR